MPDLGDRLGKYPFAQPSPLARDRQLSAFATQPPDEKNDESDQDNAQKCGNDEFNRPIPEHRWVFIVKRDFFVRRLHGNLVFV